MKQATWKNNLALDCCYLPTIINSLPLLFPRDHTSAFFPLQHEIHWCICEDMPSDKATSLTYPSDDGSDVDRSSDFWALPTFASSTSAASDQSMVTNDSKTDCEGLRVLVDYSSNSYQQRILEGVTEWCVEVMFVSLHFATDVSSRSCIEAHTTSWDCGD